MKVYKTRVLGEKELLPFFRECGYNGARIEVLMKQNTREIGSGRARVNVFDGWIYLFNLILEKGGKDSNNFLLGWTEQEKMSLDEMLDVANCMIGDLNSVVNRLSGKDYGEMPSLIIPEFCQQNNPKNLENPDYSKNRNYPK